MVNKQLAQQIVNTVRDICGHDINFINRRGIIFASTNKARIGSFYEIGKKAADTRTTIEVGAGDAYKGTSQGVNIPVYHNGALLAVIGISGSPDEVRKYAHLAEKITLLLVREQELNTAARTLTEKKTYIVETLIKGNIENPDYIFDSLRDMKISEKTRKRVLIVRIVSNSETAGVSAAEPKLYRLFEGLGMELFSFEFPDTFVGILEDEGIDKSKETLAAFAAENSTLLKMAVGQDRSIYQLDDSWRSAQTALNSLTGTETNFAFYDDLLFEIVIGSIDRDNREQFARKVLRRLSDEEIALLQVYYAEGQSLARTCEACSIHKNTLQYKLDRIARNTGLNPRHFKDAVVFYLALHMR